MGDANRSRALRLAVVKGRDQINATNTQWVVVVHATQPFSIGRSSACDWTLSDASRRISSRHCEIAWENDGFVLRDLSTNGTFIDGALQRVQGVTPIRAGSTLSIGGVMIGVAEGTAVVKLTVESPKTPAKSLVPSVLGKQMPVMRRNLDPAAAVASPHMGDQPEDDGDLTCIALASVQSVRSGASGGTVSAPNFSRVDIRGRLAAGLGVPIDALAEVDLGDLIEQLGRLARLTGEHIERQLDEKRAVDRLLGVQDGSLEHSQNLPTVPQHLDEERHRRLA